MSHWKRMFTSQMFRAGSYAAFGGVIVIAIALLVNMIAGALPASITQIDMTAQNLYSLSEQSKRIVKQIENPVDLYLLANKGYEDAGIMTLLERYEDLSDKITITQIDPSENPTFLENYEISETVYANSVIVQSGERYRFVSYEDIYVYDYTMDYYSNSYNTSASFNGENELTSAIHYAASSDLPKIYTLTGHGEMPLSDTLTADIRHDNMDLSDLSLLSLEAVPEDAQAVIIHVPTSDLSSEEAELLISYLNNGGSIILITDQMKADDMPHLKSVAAHMGLSTETGMIVEGDSSMSLRGYSWYLLPELAGHAITQPLMDNGYFVLAPMAQPLVETESDASVTFLLSTSDSAYLKAAGYDMTITEKEEGDETGPFHVAALSTLGDGSLLWVTSPALLDSQINRMVSGGNQDLFLNSLNYLCEQEESISIRAKSLDTNILTLTSAESSLWSCILVGGIPLAFLVLGLIIWIRRKRQ